MRQQKFGLSANEHLRAIGLLQRVVAGLKGLRQIVSGRYPKMHPAFKEIESSLSSVQAVRLEMENAARAEHPQRKIIYLVDGSRISADVLNHAIATPGDNIESD